MKQVLAILLAAVLMLAFAACGEKPAGGTGTQPGEAGSGSAGSGAPTEAPESAAPVTSAPEQPSEPAGISSSGDGTLVLSAAEVAVVVNGTSVPMPYNLRALEAAGVPADESRSEIELGAGDFFSANLYLDENEDYLLIPAYYNGTDSSVSITEAEAEEITMITYADAPADQGVSILGVSFGMAKSAVKELLGAPMSDDGSYCEWHIEVPALDYEGTLSMYFTGDSEDAGVSQVDLTVFPK